MQLIKNQKFAGGDSQGDWKTGKMVQRSLKCMRALNLKETAQFCTIVLIVLLAEIGFDCG